MATKIARVKCMWDRQEMAVKCICRQMFRCVVGSRSRAPEQCVDCSPDLRYIFVILNYVVVTSSLGVADHVFDLVSDLF